MHLLILGGSPDDRRRLARAYVPERHDAVLLDPRTLPFVRARGAVLPSSPCVVLVEDIELAFPDNQAGATRLVLTQSTYLVQTWIDRLSEGDRVIATADRAALTQRAPEALRRRGPWARFEIVTIDNTGTADDTADTEKGSRADWTSVSPMSSVLNSMARAFLMIDPAERVRLCREAVALDGESAVARLALASACRETLDPQAALAAIDRAAALAPDWEAVHYESGKLWLALDDMPQARDAFGRAAALMPSFSAAFSNLGATLGELGDTAAALAAFERALAHDPDSDTILNNLGVVSRELGQLDRSEAALRRVIDLAPDFVFGHYNLGHTLFLAGRYTEALHAYQEGQRLDPEKNRRQGVRLSMTRLATGDLAGATRDLEQVLDTAPAAERDDLLLEAYEIAHALQTLQPAWTADAAYREFLLRLGSQILKSE